MKWYFLRFLAYLANLIESLIKVLTLGFVRPNFAMQFENMFLDYCDFLTSLKQNNERQAKNH